MQINVPLNLSNKYGGNFNIQRLDKSIKSFKFYIRSFASKAWGFTGVQINKIFKSSSFRHRQQQKCSAEFFGDAWERQMNRYGNLLWNYFEWMGDLVYGHYFIANSACLEIFCQMSKCKKSQSKLTMSNVS